MADVARLTIRCSEQPARALKEVLDSVDGGNPKLTEQRNLSGDVSTYILIAHVTATTIALLINRLKSVPDMLPIRSLELDGMKFSNLTRKEVEKILSDYVDKKRGSKATRGK